VARDGLWHPAVPPMPAKKSRGGAGTSSAGTAQPHPGKLQGPPPRPHSAELVLMLMRWPSERAPFFDACKPEHTQALQEACRIIDQPTTRETDIRAGSAPWTLVRCRCV
jgi:hypothetical protein